MDKQMFQFYKNALTCNLCDEYKGLWRSAGDDKEKLIKLSLAQQSIPYVATFCYNGMGLTKEYIKSEFGKYINGKKMLNDCDGVDGYSYELYVDHHDGLYVRSNVVSIMWCDVDVHVDTTKCPIIYVSNKTRCRLHANGYNSIRVYLFDESEIELYDIDTTSDVTIYCYSDDCKVSVGKYCLGKFKQFQKKLVL